MSDDRGRAGDDAPGGSEPGSAGESTGQSPLRRRLRNAVGVRVGVDRRALAAFRIALGTVLLVDLGLRARNLRAFYTDAGVLPRSALAEAYPLAARFSLHAVSGATPPVALLFLVAGAAAVALAVGHRTRLAAAVSLVLLASLQARNPFVLNAGDKLLAQLLAAGLFCPLGARWSLDAVRGRPSSGELVHTARNRFVGPASALLLAVVVVVYLANAVEKLRGTAWLRGEAVGQVFRLTYLHGPLGELFPEVPALLAVATYGWLALLVASPLLVASAGRVRAALTGSLVAAHLSMALALQLGVFPLVSAAGLLPFFPPFVWGRVEEVVGPTGARLRRSAESVLANDPRNGGPRDRATRGPPDRAVGTPPGRTVSGRVATAVAAVLLVSLLAWNGMAVGLVDAPEPVATTADPTEYGWDMFAPNPSSIDARLLATATTADGDAVDALYGDPVAVDRPPSDARAYPTARWRKYLTLLAGDGAPGRVDPLLAYLCDRSAGLAGEGAASVTVSMVEIDVTEGGEARVRKLGTRGCRSG
ncbi:HTTM domain-containing protein [Halorubrum yunnanense]|uniref:HTTM domain-containing protein n=1 Tax=Halorubrum yunnanense TaxID=1526162 RepID=A0ABD5YI05_9EURY|nr:HTTM domain-containing protein [Halorubrum yunnanense]